MTVAVVVIATACAAVLGGPVCAARADGDPASDVLVAAPPLFLSFDSGATYAQKVALQRQLRHAAANGAPLRVAVIATRSDLGSLTALWGQPQEYAIVLGRELSLDYHGKLLVVMPDGFGLTRDGAPIRSPLSGLAPRRGLLITATEQAVRRLTGVTAPGASPAAVGAVPSRTAGAGWWVTTAAALVAIALAWTASLRRRPIGGRRDLAGGSPG
ncbi:MAG TPA: hypothetical protein VMF07_03095 [Solirubrobacteraceae bacterium]|nr:hypothetical protein [Solirubrobacteraceae bacterium]